MSADLVPWQEQAETSELIDAIEAWGHDRSEFLDAAVARLPETLRINPLRCDAAWTAERLVEMGGVQIDWPNINAWRMPWQRGRAPPEFDELYQALHETGRTTRQEAASMIPPLLLGVDAGDMVLDMCAAPGSKATQIAEILGGLGVIIANEKSPQRSNTLVTNSHRLALPNIVVTRHDGRNIPRPPLPGFDAVLVDAPCSGSGTTRKNPEVWGKWKEVNGRNLHKLQVELVLKAAGMVRPGGCVVYSTCSLDPVENEAVVLEVLRQNPWLKVESINVNLLPKNTSPGLSHWPDLSGGEARVSMLPPAEPELVKAAERCVRIWPDDDDSGLLGGFFFAVLRQTDSTEIDSTENKTTSPENEWARCLRRHSLDGEVVPPSGRLGPHDIRAAEADMSVGLLDMLGVPTDSGDLWRRGRRASWSSVDVSRLVFDAKWPGKKGRWHAGGQWRPLSVTLAGVPAVRVRGERIERITSQALHTLPLATGGEGRRVLEVCADVAKRIIASNRLPLDEVDERLHEMPGGGLMLLAEVDGIERRIPIWKGEWVTPMWRAEEEVVLRVALGLPPKSDFEEE